MCFSLILFNKNAKLLLSILQYFLDYMMQPDFMANIFAEKKPSDFKRYFPQNKHSHTRTHI
jgi:mannitol/fructose-specific phosphotransferase system IIA component (Ntr-type)